LWMPSLPFTFIEVQKVVKVLDDQRIKISHPTRYYFETNTERLFSLDRVFSKGETFSLPDVTISIDEMEGERVKSVEVERQ